MALSTFVRCVPRLAAKRRAASFISTNLHLGIKPDKVFCAPSSAFRTVFTSSCSRCEAQSANQDSDKPTSSDPEFRNIYAFRYIVHARVLSRFKIYQTMLTLGALPVGAALHNTGAVSTPGLAAFVGIASLATIMLYVMSTFFRRVVGIIGVNTNEEKVRISHLTFWGRRRDNVFDVSEIVPLSDLSVKPNDIFQVIQFYENPEKFFWFHRHGKNTDAEAIQRIFGKL